MTVAYLKILVSFKNLSNTLTTYIKNQCAYMKTWPIHYVSIHKDRFSLHFLIYSVGKMCALMQNARSCLYECSSSNIFGLDTLNEKDYFL